MGLEIDNDLKNGLKSCYLLYGEDSVRRKIYAVSYTHLDVYKRQVHL